MHLRIRSFVSLAGMVVGLYGGVFLIIGSYQITAEKLSGSYRDRGEGTDLV